MLSSTHVRQESFYTKQIFNKMSRKTSRVVIQNQAREIIARVYDFMKKEATKNYAAKLTDARWRTSQAVGVSEGTITRILRERRLATDSSPNPAQMCEVSIDPILPNDNLFEVSIEPSNEVTTSESDVASTSAVIKAPMKKNKANTKKKYFGRIQCKGSHKDKSDPPSTVDSQH